MTIPVTLRSVKGSPLTEAEVDGNFIGLRDIPYDPVSKTFVLDELDLGATPFVFKDLGGGVCQIADQNLTWDKINQLLKVNFQITGDPTNGLLLYGDVNNANNASLQLDPAGNIILQATNGSIAVGADGSVALSGSSSGVVAYPATGVVPNAVQFQGAGGLQPVADNSQDLGSASLRIRTGYFGTSVVSPLFSVSSGAGSSGITTTITTASLVGKTITVQGGIITGFA